MMNRVLRNAFIILDKLYSMAIDRRLVIAVLNLIIAYVGAPLAGGATDALAQEWIDALVTINQTIIAPIGLLLVIAGWTHRPPSGTNYKSSSNAEEVMQKLLS